VPLTVPTSDPLSAPTITRPAEPEPTTATVTRIGTSVVVRLSGVVDDRSAARLDAVREEVATLALHRVVIDLDDVENVDDVGLAFLRSLTDRWSTRILNPPPGLRGRLRATAEPES
jgi:ABC-type transporter Mla MlaB component